MASSSNPETDIWTPLKPGQIRLLRIEVGEDGDLEFNLDPFHLTDAPPWLALSYVWGTEPPSVEIRLNHRPHLVTPTLHAAFCAISKQRSRLFCDWIWIDAISINQSDDEEKSDQIPRMGDIYSRAYMVLIWLREERADMRCIFETLRWSEVFWTRQALLGTDIDGNPASQLASLHRSEGQAAIDAEIALCNQELEEATARLNNEFHIRRDQLNALADFARHLNVSPAPVIEKDEDGMPMLGLGNVNVEYDFWLKLMAFVTNEWFDRVWTFQELKLSLRAAIVYDHGVIRWQIVESFRCAASAVFRSIEVTMLEKGAFRCLGSAHVNRVHLEHALHMASSALAHADRQSQPEDCTLIGLLAQTRTRTAWDPRDYVFGLLGVVDEETKPMISVNYSLSAAQTFQKTVLAMIQSRAADLTDIWNYFEIYDRHVDDLPSWCPDFSGSRYGVQHSRAAKALKLDVNVKLATTSLAKVTFSQDLASISCKVMLLDTIVHVLPKPPELVQHEIVAAILKQDDDLLGKLKTVFNEDTCAWVQNMTSLLQMDQVCDLMQKSCPNTDGHEVVFYDTLSTLCAAIAQCGLKEALTDPPLSTDRKVGPHKPKYTWGDFPLSALFTGMFRLYATLGLFDLFSTAAGKLGVAYKSVDREGHVVYVPGGRSFHVLSKEKDRYKGTAYIDGFGGDELLNKVKNAPQSVWEDVSLY